MKKKQSKVAAQKNANAEQATDFPLPEPMELARLAAILRPAAPSSPDALKAAVRCYFDAAVFAREQAASEIAALLSEKYKDERRKKAVEDIKKMQAAKWEDTVTFDEARELLAHPRKLAERLGKLPKGVQPPPPPDMKIETPLHALPRLCLRRDSALKENVLNALTYHKSTLFGIKADEYAEHVTFDQIFPHPKIPVFLLEGVLRYKHEKHKESERETARRKAVKEI